MMVSDSAAHVISSHVKLDILEHRSAKLLFPHHRITQGSFEQQSMLEALIPQPRYEYGVFLHGTITLIQVLPGHES